MKGTRPITRPSSASRRDVGATGRLVRVIPSRVSIPDVTPGLTHVVVVTIANQDNHSHRVRFVPPTTPFFKLVAPVGDAIAPGLQISAELHFRFEDVGKGRKTFSDQFVVVCETDRIVIPIFAATPECKIEMDGFVNLSNLIVNQRAMQPVELHNLGRKGGAFKFKFEDHPKFILSPSAGTIDPESSVKVHVEFSSHEAGVFRNVCQLLIDDEVTGSILDLNATVIAPSVELLFPDGGGIVENLQFGTLYYGQTKVIDAIAFNNSPLPTNFEFEVVAQNEEDRVFHVSKPSGRLAPFERTVVSFAYAPKKVAESKGFKSTAKDPVDDKADYSISCNLRADEYSQSTQIGLLGKALRVCVDLSTLELHLGEIACNSHVDAIVEIKNKQEDLPIEFSIPRVAHFKVRPATGRLLPLQSSNIIVTFCPNQMGSHNNVLHVSICNGIEVIPVNVFGACTSDTLKKTLVGGPTATHVDFKPTFNFMEPHDMSLQPQQRPQSFKRRKPWEKYELPRSELANLDTYTIEEFETLDGHKKKYETFIKDSRVQREMKANEMSYEDIVKFELGAEMGMEPYGGMAPPEPRPSKRVDPLFLKSKTGSVGHVKPATKIMDEDRLFTRKFKSKPETSKEMHECKGILGAKELLSISTYPRNIDFGNVCVQSTIAKSFCLTNGTRQNVIVAITPGCEELGKSFPDSQVIPPGGTAGFDIVFYAEVLKTITYTINAMYSYELPVSADVVPVMLRVQRSSIILRFPPSSNDFSTSDTISLVNPGNNRADFSFDCGGDFKIVPQSGSVDPLGHFDATVFYTPGSQIKSETDILMKIVGGQDMVLHVSGEVEEGRVVVKEKAVDFGSIPAGITKFKSITLKNVGETDAVFAVDVGDPSVTASPPTGRIALGASAEVQLGLKPVTSLSLKSTCTVLVRGGKSCRIALTADVQVPDVEIKTDELDFGMVYLGARKTLSLTIENRSSSPAVCLVDFRTNRDFSVIIPPALADEDDDEHSSASNATVPTSADGRRMRSQTISSAGSAVRAGQLHRFRVGSESTATVEVVFAPNSLAQHAFELPLSVLGLPEDKSSLLQRTVIAEALKPRLAISESVIDFGRRVVISERMKKLSYGTDLTLANVDNSRLLWSAVLKHSSNTSVFKLTISGGELEIGQSVMSRVTFVPPVAERFSASLMIFINGATKPYAEIPVSGEGMQPRLSFDRREIILPVVPLDVPSMCTFNIINEGYDNLELKYLLPAETSRIPLSLSFPEGNMVGVSKSKLPVIVTFISKKSIAFSAKVHFLDADGNRFSIVVVGTTDNCVLSLSPFLAIKRDIYAVGTGEEKPTILLPAIDSVPLTGDYSDVREAQFFSEEKNLKEAIRWFNLNLFRTPVAQFPDDLVAQKGKPIVDVIEYFAGKSVPGGNKKMSNNRREVALSQLSAFTELLNFLKSYGALVNNVKPELLLSYDDFVRIYIDVPDDAPLRLSDQLAEFFDVNFHSLATAAWAMLAMQVVKVFVLNRVTPKLMKGLPGISKEGLAAKPLVVCEAVLTQSNYISPPEGVLLMWLTYHFVKVYPADSRRVSNFSSDLRDGRVFAAAILSHVPGLKVLSGLKKSDKQAAWQSNAQAVVTAMSEIGLDYVPSSSLILEGSELELMLLALSLFHVLPSYVPKATLEFDGRLNERISKQIELSNPSGRPLVYLPNLAGSSAFSMASGEVRIDPRSSVLVPIDFFPRFSRPSEGSVRFACKREPGGAVGSTLVFNLKGAVESFKPSDSINVDARLYDLTPVELMVANPFSNDGDFTICLKEDEDVSVVKAAPAKRGAKGKPTISSVDAVTSHAVLPKTGFFCKRDKIKIRAGEKVPLLLSFLPLRLAKYKATIFLKDEACGEFVLEVTGESTLPVCGDSIKFSAENRATIVKDIMISAKNVAFEKCRSGLVERFGAAAAKELLKSIYDVTGLDYSVEYLSPFLSGPQHVTVNEPVGTARKKGEEGKSEGRDTKTPRGSADANRLSLEVRPKGPGMYSGKIILRSALDIRVVEVECTVSAMGSRASLDFSCPARQSVTQEVPVINVSDKDWAITASLSGDNFFGLKEFKVAAHGRANYLLSFKPKWICETTGELILTNVTTSDKYIYTLKGVGEEPVAEDTIHMKCKARWKESIRMAVPNLVGKDTTVRVESDLLYISGDDSLRLENGDGEYLLSFNMPRGGLFEGSVSFLFPNGEYVWYALEIEAENPPAEREVTVTTLTRSAVAVDISISNPMARPIEFNVLLVGEGLLGEPSIKLGAHETASYELVYSPLLPGSTEGSITFINDDIGEFWYRLLLTADAPPPVVLPPMKAEIGKSHPFTVQIENPLPDVAVFEFESNLPNGLFLPEFAGAVEVAPYETLDVTVFYKPSFLGKEENGAFAFRNELCGEFVFQMQGSGVAPSSFDSLVISCSLGTTASQAVTFENPFDVPIVVSYALVSKESASVFALSSSRTRDINIGPNKQLQIPIIFQPARMTEHTGAIEVTCADPKVTFRYPIVGVAEAPQAGSLGRFVCKSRDRLERLVDVELSGATLEGEEAVTHSVSCPDAFNEVVNKSLNIELFETHVLSDTVVRLKYRVVFEPLKPFKTKAELVVTKNSGGRWRFVFEVSATDPDPDDTVGFVGKGLTPQIVIESALYKTSSISFKLTNSEESPATFRAYFSEDTPHEFVVKPTQGTLDGASGSGTPFFLSFTPNEYGKVYNGKLIIETSEMQWTYEVRGTYPQYVPPKKEAKVDARISETTSVSLMHRNEKDYLLENARAVRALELQRKKK